MSALVVDASAILAAILGERGGDTVFERMETAAVSTVNLAEVYSFAAIRNLPTEAIDAFVADTGIEVAAFDHRQAIAAGQLAGITRKAGLSLGDRACLALAARRKAEVLTADRPWQAIAHEVGLVITLLR